jgi:hypothetical protein
VNRENKSSEYHESSAMQRAFQRPVIVAVVVAWVVLFVSVVALSQVSQEQTELPDDTGRGIVVSESFSLQNAPASSIRIHANVPMRVEDSGLAILDAGGREQSFIQYPYRQPSLHETGDALMIVPRHETEMMLVLPDATTIELVVEMIVQCGDYRDGYVLALGQAANNVTGVSLYKIPQATPLLEIPISEDGRPIRVSFAKSGRFFDVLLADFSDGRPVTRVQRFSFSGDLVSDRRYSDFSFMPAILQLHDKEQVLFNERDILAINPESGEVRLTRSFDQIVQIELKSGCLGMRTIDDGRMSLLFLREASDRSDRVFIEAECEEELLGFALSSDGVYALGVTEKTLKLFDTMTGKLVSERDGLLGMTRVLTITERDFLVLTEEEAAIVSIR